MAEKKSILTLNLGSQRVGMARFGIGSKGSVMLREYAFEEIPGEVNSESERKSLVSAAIKSLAAQLRAKDLPVNYAVPAQNTITRFVKLPSLGEDQVDKIVGFEAQQAVPFPLTETVWDYQIMGQAGGEVEVAIVAVRADQLEEMNQMVKGASLSTKLVEAAPLALYNCFRYNYGDPKEPTMLIDLGAKTTNLIFMEGGRVFISSFQNAASQITQAISKEMNWSFADAEARKKADGFVHLGGNYEDHQDQEVDAISKVIRNQLTRLHGDINRRTQQYRQQGGSAPAAVYLCGGGANLPYLKEFFEEKLRVEVNWFNALQNVSVGPKVNVEEASREAHLMGELVGLALREMGCPMELDLSPKSVETARSVSSKKPILITAAVCLAAALGALWTNLHFTTQGTNNKIEKIQKITGELQGYANGINNEIKRQKEEEARAGYLAGAVSGRNYWLSVLNTLNTKLGSDMWITQLNPIDPAGLEIQRSLIATGVPVPPEFISVSSSAPTAPPGPPGTQRKTVIDVIHVVGLYLVRPDQSNDVRNIFAKIKEDMKDVFEIPDDWEANSEKWLKINTGNAASEWASRFEMRLPLKNKLKVTAEDTKR